MVCCSLYDRGGPIEAPGGRRLRHRPGASRQCYFLRCGKTGGRFSLTAATPSATSALKKPNISNASDASKCGPKVLTQLLRARLVKREACCGPRATLRATSKALSMG